MRYEYVVNLDERGEFNADVRDEAGNTVHEVATNPETGEVFEVESGYMKHARDVDGLADYLRDLGIFKQGDYLAGHHPATCTREVATFVDPTGALRRAGLLIVEG